MDAKESTEKAPNRIDVGIRRLSKELNREDSQLLRSYLLDAALSGLRLTRNPESRELRRDAVQIWAAIEPILVPSSGCRRPRVASMVGPARPSIAEVGRNVRECHDRLRTLIGVIADTGADRLTEAEALDAGRALSGLAVYLDDAIDNEELRLFPTIQQALFRLGRHA